MTAPILVVAMGAIFAAGVWLIAAGLTRQPPRLADALRALDEADGQRSRDQPDVPELGALERAGAAIYRRLRLPLSSPQRIALRRAERSVGDFFAEKLIWTLIGMVTPAVVAGLVTAALGLPGYAPLGAALAGGIIGFFVPDLLLRRRATADHTGGREALFTYFDLVVLERLANRSGPQALAAAAQVSRHPVFASIAASLERARLEQTTPYENLRTLAQELDFTELHDIADVMRLDDSGASLADVLRARVKELRDAHLTAQKISAQAVSERMTLPMTVPTLVFTLILFVPPLLRLATG